MSRLVMKFGGTSIADNARIVHAARHVQREVEADHHVVVIVSAMAGETNRLVALCQDIAPIYDAREYDVVVTTGEQITSGLMVLALQQLGIEARSWLGWQVPIQTNELHGAARITNIPTDKIKAQFDENRVVVVPGFQGISQRERITSLGRGGSDATAVAVAAALNAERCDIYTDVDGVYTADPNVVEDAHKLERISYEETLEMASLGTRVLQTRSAELAALHQVKLQVRSSFDDPKVKTQPNAIIGTLICREEEIMEQETITSIAYARNQAKVTLQSVPDQPGAAARIFTPLAKNGINVDMIVQNVTADGKATDVTFTVEDDDLEHTIKIIRAARNAIGYQAFNHISGMAKISVIGIGMRSHAGVAQKMFEILGDKNINIYVISTSEIKISVLINGDYTELAQRALHTGFDLDATEKNRAVKKR